MNKKGSLKQFLTRETKREKMEEKVKEFELKSDRKKKSSNSELIGKFQFIKEHENSILETYNNKKKKFGANSIDRFSEIRKSDIEIVKNEIKQLVRKRHNEREKTILEEIKKKEEETKLNIQQKNENKTIVKKLDSYQKKISNARNKIDLENKEKSKIANTFVQNCESKSGQSQIIQQNILNEKVNQFYKNTKKLKDAKRRREDSLKSVSERLKILEKDKVSKILENRNSNEFKKKKLSKPGHMNSTTEKGMSEVKKFELLKSAQSLNYESILRQKKLKKVRVLEKFTRLQKMNTEKNLRNNIFQASKLRTDFEEKEKKNSLVQNTCKIALQSKLNENPKIQKVLFTVNEDENWYNYLPKIQTPSKTQKKEEKF